MGSNPGLERLPGEGNGNPLQHSCLENPMDRGTWWATVHGSQRLINSHPLQLALPQEADGQGSLALWTLADFRI